MTHDYRLAYSTLAWGPTFDLEACLATIAGDGWAGLECINVSLEWLGTPDRVRRHIEASGLEPVAFFGPIASIADGRDTNTRTLRALEFAAEVGFSTFGLVGSERIAYRPSTDRDIADLGEATEWLIDHAEPLGLTVVHHAHLRSTVESQTETDRLLAASPRLGVCLDISVATLMGEDPVAQLQHFGDRVRYVHLKDWKNSRPEPLGEGNIDIPAFVTALGDVGYRGWVATELSPYADYEPEAASRANRAYLRALGL